MLGIGVPQATPMEIIDKLNREINAALTDPKITARLAVLGGTPLGGSPADFAKLIAEETEKWGKVIKFAGIKPEYKVNTMGYSIISRSAKRSTRPVHTRPEPLYAVDT